MGLRISIRTRRQLKLWTSWSYLVHDEYVAGKAGLQVPLHSLKNLDLRVIVVAVERL